MNGNEMREIARPQVFAKGEASQKNTGNAWQKSNIIIFKMETHTRANQIRICDAKQEIMDLFAMCVTSCQQIYYTLKSHAIKINKRTFKRATHLYENTLICQLNHTHTHTRRHLRWFFIPFEFGRKSIFALSLRRIHANRNSFA